jgi:biopolymer transport protein ExbD
MDLNFNDDEYAEIDMSPMIDMVFLLLIFFLVATVVIDLKVPVTVPTAYYSKVADNIEGRIILSIKPDGKLFVGLKEATLEEVKTALTKAREDDPKIIIQIRSDGNVKYKINEELMAACAEVGVLDLIYSTYEQ